MASQLYDYSGQFGPQQEGQPPYWPPAPISTGGAPEGLPISTGQAPAPGLPVGTVQPTFAPSDQLAQQVANTPQPAGAQPMNFRQGLGLAILGAGDVAGNIAALRRGEAPRSGSNFLTGLQGIQQQQMAAEKAVQVDRQWRAEMMTKIGNMKAQETGAVKEALSVVAEVAKNPNATPEDHRAAVQRAVGMMAKFGWDAQSSEMIAGSLVRSPNLSRVLGEYLGAFDQTKETDRAQIQDILHGAIAAGSGGAGALEQYATAAQARVIRSKIAPEALTTAMMAAQSIKQSPNYDGKPIPFQDIAAHVRTKYGDKAGLHIQYLSGIIGDGKEQVRDFLASAGIETPATAQAGQQAGATAEQTARGTSRAKTDPKVVAAEVDAENQKEAGTRLEKAATAASQETAKILGQTNPAALAGKEAEERQKMRLEQEKKALEARFAATNPADDTQVGGLRKEFASASQRFVEVKNGFQQIKAGAESKTPQGDITLVYGFMKMLDPGSVVREGEYATASNAAGIPERVRNMWNRLMDGDKLTDGQRAGMVQQAQKLFEQHSGNQRELASEYTRLAKANRMDPARVIVDYFGREGTPTVVPSADQPKRGRPVQVGQ